MRELNREMVLEMIFDHLDSAASWDMFKTGEAGHRLDHITKAEALIELLEVADCGSVGGFDHGQPRPKDLYDRYDWLKNKKN